MDHTCRHATLKHGQGSHMQTCMLRLLIPSVQVSWCQRWQWPSQGPRVPSLWILVQPLAFKTSALVIDAWLYKYPIDMLAKEQPFDFYLLSYCNHLPKDIVSCRTHDRGFSGKRVPNPIQNMLPFPLWHSPPFFEPNPCPSDFTSPLSQSYYWKTHF